MTDKYPLPFALSAATLLVACLVATSHHARAAEAEEPAVLQFATTYAEQKPPSTPAVRPLPLPAIEHENTVKPRPRPHIVQQPAPQHDNRRLTTLKQVLAEQEQKISQKNTAITQLEKQIAALQQAAATLKQPQPGAVEKASHFNPADQQAMLDMVSNLRQIFSLTPRESALRDKLTVLKKQLHDAQQVETGLRDQLKAASNSEVRDAGLQQQIEQYHQQIATLEERLSARGKEAENATAERDRLQSSLQALTAKRAAEQQTFSEETQQLQALKTKLQEARLTETALRDQLKTLSDSKTSTAEAQAALQQQIAALEERLSARGKEAENATAERDRLQSSLQALTAKRAVEQQTFAEETQQLQALKTKLQEARLTETSLRDQLKTLSDSKTSTASAREAALQQQIATLEERLSARGKEAENATAERDRLQSSLQALTAKRAVEQQTFAEETQQLQALKTKLQEARLTETSLRDQLKTLSDSKTSTASAREAALQQQIATLEERLSARSKAVDSATEERDSLQSSLQALTAKNTGDQQTFADEKQQLLKKIAGDRSAADAQQVALQQQLEQLKQQLNDAQQSKTALESDKVKLQAQLTTRPTPEQLAESQLVAKSLQSKLDQIDLYGAAKPDAPVTVAAVDKDKQKALEQMQAEKLAALQAKLDDALAKLAASEKQQKEVKPENSLPALTPEKLNKKESREAYAIGMSLGDEILQMQAENRNWGTSSDQTIVLAGIVDAFKGQAKLSTDVLRKTLKEVSSRVEKDQKSLTTNLDKATKAYLQRFTKMKGTHKSPSGFWYNISYIGDTPLPKNAALDVVVKESLTNGDVITDMDTSGMVLTQPLADYPPVFSEALSKLKNHGSITIVVPPELAYKDRGLPPKIPPNATMVYNLRIAESYPPGKSVK
ncbi:FKBP-type peptidyl-prolyl cis-trans isomerase N-terminal domain-containing protein [Erwinia persicina]|uniref:FKBP-type peptidyl-prolyl cis-trans isomerase N-terminal domain-containing protein n=1 Tax=Erwinia persicina TaxID=55211 RepID=UPI00177AFFD9|nr:FKBP-type peptidyl-prolyl cis-trans isomerase N-terminal domain-containing protein [Erwinia persicina]MBD8164988.1 FKBP-type peptidyl-prolyl cis-trans isomerase [Erwinia persicina]